MDLPPLDPCPANPNGAHKMTVLAAVNGETGEVIGDQTGWCERCGAVRRVPGTGALVPQGVDDVVTITLPNGLGTWETR